MFTGIIEAVGSVKQVIARGQDLSLLIDTGTLDLSDVKLGDSIAVNGVCLTVVRLEGCAFWADVSAESLVHTNMAAFRSGQRVNLERALTLATRLGGHLVSGHVDGLGTIAGMTQDGRSVRIEVAYPAALAKFIAEKGSITVDGASLTVTHLSEGYLGLNIVPHTQGETIMMHYEEGDCVHLEVDLVARYTERLLQFEKAETNTGHSRLDKAFLAENGFLRRS